MNKEEHDIEIESKKFIESPSTIKLEDIDISPGYLLAKLHDDDIKLLKEVRKLLKKVVEKWKEL